MASSPKSYFVGHHFSPEKIQDLRSVIDGVCNPYGFIPFYADRGVESQSILFKVCQKIFITDFSIFDLSSENPNVYLELGIAFAFNKRILLIAERECERKISPLFRGQSILLYPNYQDLTQQLTKAIELNLVPNPYIGDYCSICRRICDGLSAVPKDRSYLFLEKGDLLSRYGPWQDVRAAIESSFSKYSLIPKSLNDSYTGPVLCKFRASVKTSLFSIFHLGSFADINTYFGLGVAIGRRAPWLLISKKYELDKDQKSVPVVIPSNLQGIDRIEYESLAELKNKLDAANFIKHVLSATVASGDISETVLELPSIPFWTLLNDWIDKNYQLADADTGTLKGGLQLVQIEREDFTLRFPVSKSGILIGRDSSCRIFVDHPLVSNIHAKIFFHQSDYYLQDLKTTNGTTVNGQPLPSNAVVKIVPGSIIRVPGAKFLVWDERDLPTPSSVRIRRNRSGTMTTGLLSRELVLPDEIPPDDPGLWDDTFFLSISGRVKGIFEIQSYYHFGAILKELAREYGFSEKDYCFSNSQGELLDDKDSPLDRYLRESATFYIILFKNLVSGAINGSPYRLVSPNSTNPSIDWLLERDDYNEVLCLYSVKYDLSMQDLIRLHDFYEFYSQIVDTKRLKCRPLIIVLSRDVLSKSLVGKAEQLNILILDFANFKNIIDNRLPII